MTSAAAIVGSLSPTVPTSVPRTDRRLRVAVVYGGRSSEHGVSVVSAGSVLAALDPTKYEVVTVGITRGGQWVVTDVTGEHLAITDGRLPEVAGPMPSADRRLRTSDPSRPRA